MSHSSRRETEDRVLAALPGWVNALAQLNRLIADRMGVAPSDLDCLHVLNQHGPATAAELARRVGLTPGSVSRMIDRLDAAGCITRVSDPGDRRRVLIETTAESLTRIAAYFEGLAARTHEDLEVFGTEELGSLLRFVERSERSTLDEVTHLRDNPAKQNPQETT
ncbi:MarR family transcriptional regulator [Nocardia sp. NEAU-G5]|uniref:MarR family transcriptional regulator n=1 Tax=Nocardia albiluteola TaxID=2842303 RepID=A0ABS6B2U0_9NOCA|nr:MarR family transcriptional regulator [Nocardia albiluteola]MBU3064554.1 MarR family transcriptional regulator [Nocardia albiluteola]